MEKSEELVVPAKCPCGHDALWHKVYPANMGACTYEGCKCLGYGDPIDKDYNNLEELLFDLIIDVVFQSTDAFDARMHLDDERFRSRIKSFRSYQSLLERLKGNEDAAYLLEELILDPLENEISAAFRYESKGVAKTEIEALEWVSERPGEADANDCWALGSMKWPWRRYRIVEFSQR